MDDRGAKMEGGKPVQNLLRFPGKMMMTAQWP